MPLQGWWWNGEEGLTHRVLELRDLEIKNAPVIT